MNIYTMGIDYTTGNPLAEPVDEQMFGAELLRSFDRNADAIRRRTEVSASVLRFQEEARRLPAPDPRNPCEAGWTFLVNGNDPHLANLVEIIRPLARHRGMVDPSVPLIYHGEREEAWGHWLQTYYAPPKVTPPHYILILGGPGQVPFHFQSLLGSIAAVGRVDFERLEDVQTYIDKVIRLEQADEPVPERRAIFLATEYPPPEGYEHDATYFSRRYLAEPLASYTRNECGFAIDTLMGDAATKRTLLEKLGSTRPALVYTASHGLGAPHESLDTQRRINGAICCHRTGGMPLQEWLLAADDIPYDRPFLEGAVFFEFACFGYGTPAQSDFAHWLGDARLNAGTDFVAALPKRLLAHPRGPVAFIGHVDTAWVYGFFDSEQVVGAGCWTNRAAPFVGAIGALLRDLQPTGQALTSVHEQYNIQNALITSDFDLRQRGRLEQTLGVRARLAGAFILRGDAQNYMVFGDPACRIRVPAASK
jgi:hypothetical protein